MEKDPSKFGRFLRTLREEAKLSVRQAAKEAGISSAYLSQIETGKRGARKGGAFFAPHPDILRKLADVYSISPSNLFEEAGYFENEQEYRGFSEEKEIRRVFHFVVHDPAVREVFSLQDMRAIVERYQTLTGKRLLTWAGDEGPLSKKTEFQGLHIKDGVLTSELSHMLLTLDEVATELDCRLDVVHHLILNDHIDVVRDLDGQIKIERSQLRSLKTFLLGLGLTHKLISPDFRNIKPANPEDLKTIEALADKNQAPKGFRNKKYSREMQMKFYKKRSLLERMKTGFFNAITEKDDNE